jgi:hypothetical protein
MKRGALIASGLIPLAVVAWLALKPRAPKPLPPHAGPPEALAKLDEIRAILASRNDNDPRLDRDFNALTPDDKRLFREEYSRIPAEKRNERGTLIFLLGRNMTEPGDWAFMKGVALEPPCLSLSDCAKSPGAGGGEEAAGDEVTLAYPSLVALKQAQRALEDAPSNKDALDVLTAAKASRTRAVARMAAALERRFAPR